MKHTNLFIRLSLILLAIISCNNSITENGNDAILDWAQDNASEIETLELTNRHDDLELLEQIIGEAQLVCLGESRHDIREQFMLKHRFIKYLVEELGFTTLILEASIPYSKEINEYILTGDGNLEDIMANMPGWFLWDTQEMTDIFNWMRDYNTDPENLQKLKFFGIDIMAPNNGLDQIFDFLRIVDQKALENFESKEYARSTIEDDNWQQTFQGYSGLSAGQKQILNDNYEELYMHLLQNESEYISLASAEEFNWILRLAYSARAANEMFSAEERIDMGLIRDNAMAQNTLWIKNSLSHEKIIVWAHNVHIATSEFTMSIETESIKGMGYLLKKELGEDMVSIGAAFNHGEFQDWNRSFPYADSNTIDGTLAQLGMNFALIDLNGETDNEHVLDWLNTGNVLRAMDFYMTCVPTGSFDAFYFTDSISRTTPNPESLLRFREQ